MIAGQGYDLVSAPLLLSKKAEGALQNDSIDQFREIA